MESDEARGTVPHADQSKADPPVLPAVARGEPAAIAEVLRRYGSVVLALARRRARDRADAEDAVQEIFLDLWRSAGRFDPERCAEPVFVMMIARRRLIDRLRHHGRRRDREVPLEDLDNSLGATADERAAPDALAEVRIARDVLATLPAAQARIIDLSLAQGLSHAEIAEREQLPLGTVKTVIRRGLIRVRQALGLASVGGDT